MSALRRALPVQTTSFAFYESKIDASGVVAALNLPGTAPLQRVQPMTRRAGVTAGTAPNAPPARHQRRPHQHTLSSPPSSAR
ncbi:hypothetical protein QQF64_009310 [Cirrhinus molitorella]|uniref:Uncharacterized protein n=1 Tax=Cirrhinus molitorella TaxID=172907 RepID=A0ABR3M0U1_9TELE